ncbi:MAG: hypothetical protein KatS3mg029_0267 [Saprospiraceae bacterium]|nr:MAG: hypothetical protein KatS3mg029_0267 [Saprospiraceae bacterium]
MLTAVIYLLLAFNLASVLSERSRSALRDGRFWMLIACMLLMLVLTIRAAELG